MRAILRLFVHVTRPLVRRMASAYDLRLNYPWEAQGQHSLVFEDDARARRHHVPKSVYFNTRSGSITVGEGTVFGEDVQVLTGKHANVEESARLGVPHHDVPLSGRDIRIGRDCYVGGGAIIVGPVTIGDEAVVGAGSVVTRDVPSRAFVAGVPAKVVRMLAGPGPTVAEPKG